MRTRRGFLMVLVAGALLTGCGSSDEGDKTISLELQTELMSRWNEVGAGVTVPPFGGFSWMKFDEFPHPTFKGGSQEAYRRFAEILVAFFERNDNFEFLTNQGLLRVRLPYGGQTGNVDTSFAELTNQFVTNNWAGVSDATLLKLKAFDARIRMAP